VVGAAEGWGRWRRATWVLKLPLNTLKTPAARDLVFPEFRVAMCSRSQLSPPTRASQDSSPGSRPPGRPPPPPARALPVETAAPGGLGNASTFAGSMPRPSWHGGWRSRGRSGRCYFCCGRFSSRRRRGPVRTRAVHGAVRHGPIFVENPSFSGRSLPRRRSIRELDYYMLSPKYRSVISDHAVDQVIGARGWPAPSPLCCERFPEGRPSE